VDACKACHTAEKAREDDAQKRAEKTILAKTLNERKKYAAFNNLSDANVVSSFKGRDLKVIVKVSRRSSSVQLSLAAAVRQQITFCNPAKNTRRFGGWKGS
jgi:hypothetical protein